MIEDSIKFLKAREKSIRTVGELIFYLTFEIFVSGADAAAKDPLFMTLARHSPSTKVQQ